MDEVETYGIFFYNFQNVLEVFMLSKLIIVVCDREYLLELSAQNFVVKLSVFSIATFDS